MIGPSNTIGGIIPAHERASDQRCVERVSAQGIAAGRQSRRMAVDGATPNRASVARLLTPASIAVNTRGRTSIERGCPVEAALREVGWYVTRKRVKRIRRREGLSRCRGSSRSAHGSESCIRLRPEYPAHVWFYDSVEGSAHDGGKFRILSIIDEAGREHLALPTARRHRSEDRPGCSSRGPPVALHIAVTGRIARWAIDRRSSDGDAVMAVFRFVSLRLRPTTVPVATRHQQSTRTTQRGSVSLRGDGISRSR